MGVGKARQGYKLADWYYGKELEIPEEWEIKQFGSAISKIENGLPYKEEWEDSETKKKNATLITRIETISDEAINPEKVGYVKGLSKNDFVKYRLMKGDILFSHINSLKHIGKTAMYENQPIVLIHGMNLLRIQASKDFLLPYYLLYFLKHNETRDRVKALSQRAINQVSINTHDLKKFLMTVIPPISEQQKIVSILSNVDEQIQQTQKLIDLTQRLKKGLMQKLLTRGIGHTKFKKVPWYYDKTIEIPEEWKVTTLKNLLDKQNSGLHNKLEKTSLGDNIVSMTDLYTHDFIDDEEFMLANFPIEIKGKKLNKQKYLLKKNDFLYIEISLVKEGVGKTSLVKKNGGGTYFAGNLRRFTTKQSVNPNFLFYFLNLDSSRNYFVNHSYTSAQTGITIRDYFKIRILTPPLEEQQKIASIISNVDEQINQHKNEKALLERIKKGLMQQLLTGQKRVILE